MTDCPFTLNADGLWDCPQCEKPHPLKLDKPPRRNCPKSPDLRPAAEKLGIKWKDVSRYMHALHRWTAAGFPVRTQEEIETCFQICQGGCGSGHCRKPCEHYRKGKTPDGGLCAKCGCNVSKSGMAVLNMAAMKTESCSEGKWPD